MKKVISLLLILGMLLSLVSCKKSKYDVNVKLFDSPEELVEEIVNALNSDLSTEEIDKLIDWQGGTAYYMLAEGCLSCDYLVAREAVDHLDDDYDDFKKNCPEFCKNWKKSIDEEFDSDKKEYFANVKELVGKGADKQRESNYFGLKRLGTINYTYNEGSLRITNDKRKNLFYTYTINFQDENNTKWILFLDIDELDGKYLCYGVNTGHVSE